MLFKVEMVVNLPLDMPENVANDLKTREKALAQSLMASGKWRHLWRVVGQYANVSVFDVDSNTELHDLLMQLPLYPYMDVTVTPLCRHPSSIYDNDQ
ncbi:muconolactone Delta-isomerase [Neisseriaceae bacterium CLB008]|nr:muconolactone Delta-isomerase [Neisseriaceae bacterium]